MFRKRLVAASLLMLMGASGVARAGPTITYWPGEVIPSEYALPVIGGTISLTVLILVVIPAIFAVARRILGLFRTARAAHEADGFEPPAPARCLELHRGEMTKRSNIGRAAVPLPPRANCASTGSILSQAGRKTGDVGRASFQNARFQA